MKDFMVFPATGLDVRAAPALATLATMQAAEESGCFEEDSEEEWDDLPAKFLSMSCISTSGSPRKRTFSDQLILRNTFIAAPLGRSPSLDRFYEERQVKSNPPSGCLEVAVVIMSPRRHGSHHKRVMSALEEALRCDTDASGEASSTRSSGLKETCTTGEGTPEIMYASATPPVYGDYGEGKEASEESWPFVEAEVLDVSESLPGLSLPMDVSYYMMPGQQTELEPGFAEPTTEPPLEATSPTNAGLSTVQYFAHTASHAGPPAALSTEPMVQVSMHGVKTDFQQPATTLRREILRARGAAVVEAAGWRSTGTPTSLAAPSGFLLSEAPCSPSSVTCTAPSTPPGTFITAGTTRTSWMKPTSVGQQWRGQQRPMPPPPPPPPCIDGPSSPHELMQSDRSGDFPSRGSALHMSGKCKPCAFFFEGCNNGASCQFCHLCEPGERLRRKKEKMSLRREAREGMRRRMDRLEKDGWATQQR
jgi:hypothetical protein